MHQRMGPCYHTIFFPIDLANALLQPRTIVLGDSGGLVHAADTHHLNLSNICHQLLFQILLVHNGKTF